MKWQFGIIAAATLALSACGTQNFQQDVIRVAAGEKRQGKTTGQFPRFTPLFAAKQGPALDVQIPKLEVRGGFLREAKRGNIESWLGTDGVTITFDRGVLHGTRGVGAGLLASDVSRSASAILAGRSGEVDRIHTFLDGDDQAVVRAYSCTISNNGSETIKLDTGPVSTRKMTETCRNLTQEFNNVYWVDTNRGRIVQSVQWGGETVGDIVITTVYKF